MNNQFERYPEYKSSGVEWLGNVPANWQLISNKNIFKIRKDLVGKNSSKFKLLSLTLNGVIERDMENPQGKFPAEFDTYQKVNYNDFIFCLFDVEETPRTVGLSKFNGMITGAYTVMEIHHTHSNEYFYYFYLNIDSAKMMKPLYTGLRNTIQKDSFMSFKSFVPQIEEQKRIAEFLDKKTAQIDQAISQKQQLIELLKERRQIVIHNAVTRGLNPDAPMKPSGIDWIGSIPAHWQIKKLKHISLINPTSKPAPLDRNTLIEFIPMENVDESNGVIKKYNYRPLKEVNQGYTSFRNDDIIFAKITPCMENGNCAIVSNLSHDICYGSTEFVVFRNNYLVNNGFLYLLLRSKSLRNIFEINMHGSAGQKRIGTDFIANFSVTLPPINEQQQIVEYLDKITTKIEAAITCKQNEIEKLKEYKATLINSAVTGKIKV